MEHPKGNPMVVPANEGRKMFALGNEVRLPADEPPDRERVMEIFNSYDIEVLEAPSEYAKTG